MIKKPDKPKAKPLMASAGAAVDTALVPYLQLELETLRTAQLNERIILEKTRKTVVATQTKLDETERELKMVNEQLRKAFRTIQ
jgi:hypothetical protein